VPYYLSSKLDLPISSPEHNLEGGNFQANGAGLCVMSNWAVDENAGFGLDQADVVNIFETYYGCTDVLIVPQMIREGTGHVDMWLAFVDEDTVLVGEYEPGLDDENMNLLDSNATLLANHPLPGGGTLEVIRIPMPDGDCLCGNGSMNCCVWRTYTNVVYVDSAVLVPEYATDPTSNAPADLAREAAAMQVWADVQPDRDVIGINSADLIYLAGSIHCISQTWSYGTSLPADSAECTAGTANASCAPPADTFAEVEDVPPLEAGCAVVAPAGAAGCTPCGLVALAGLVLGGALVLRRRRS
jgi:agmatine/peptidylarginine deiminase